MIKFAYERKALEINNYNVLISSLNDYEKNVLAEYSNEDDDLVFFNPKNKILNQNVLRIKNYVKNPYSDLYDWIQEEEVETEAMIEAINSLKTLQSNKQNLVNKKESTENTLKEVASGKKSIKTMFTFKSSSEDITNLRNYSAKVSLYIYT